MKSQTTSGRMLQSGFTLIELIIVIVIVGIMAAVALPAYTGLAAEARDGVLKGVAGSMASAAATNYALKSGGLAAGKAVGTCAAALALITKPDEVKLTGGTTIPTDGTAGGSCVLTHDGGGAITVQVMGAPV